MAEPPPYSAAEAGGPRRVLRELREIMADTASAQERLDRLAHTIAEHMHAEVCSIYLRRKSDTLELFATEGLNPGAVHETRLRLGEGLVGHIAETGQPLNLADAPIHPNFAYRPETGEDPLHAFLGVPMLRSGQVLGVLVMQNQTTRRYSDDEVEALQTVAMVLAEVAASGNLVDSDDMADVDDVLHRPERVQALGIVGGVGIGKAAFHEPPIRAGKVIAENVRFELHRLTQGIRSLRASVDKMLTSVDVPLTGVPREVLETYRMFAYDRGWAERLREAVLGGLTAEAAVLRVKADHHDRLKTARDPYLRERIHDLDDLAHRLLRHLSGNADAGMADLPDDAILFARALGPAELLEYGGGKLRGIVLGEGSAASHVAIVARALEIPLLGRAGAAIDHADTGDDIVIDGDSGEILIRPTDETLNAYLSKLALFSQRQAAFAALRDKPARTCDGVDVSLNMNAGLQVDLEHLDETGADGIGLFRTELQFMVSAALPRLEEQKQLYGNVVKAAGDKPIVFRTVDLGGDKVLPYMRREREPNPALGWRAIRMSLDRPGLLRMQLRALISAAAGRELRVLFPMITLGDELRQAKSLLQKELGRAVRLGETPPENVLVGAMIEVPSAAHEIEKIAEQADFLSVGGNDLMQFYFAADRESTLLHGRYDFLNPGFLKLLKHIADRAKAAGKPLSFCGEQASDPCNALALLGVGFRSLSLPAPAIGPIKQLIRDIDCSAFETYLSTRLDAREATLRQDIEDWAAANGAT